MKNPTQTTNNTKKKPPQSQEKQKEKWIWLSFLEQRGGSVSSALTGVLFKCRVSLKWFIQKILQILGSIYELVLSISRTVKSWKRLSNFITASLLQIVAWPTSWDRLLNSPSSSYICPTARASAIILFLNTPGLFRKIQLIEKGIYSHGCLSQ